MTPEQFWYDDIRLIQSYEIKYYSDVTYRAWVQGNYDMIAVEKGARNALTTKKEHIDRKWVDYNDPIERILNKMSEEDNKREQRNQENWFYNTFFA